MPAAGSKGLEPPEVILASASRVRHDLLRRAGLTAAVEPAAIDEAEVRLALRAEGARAAAVAETLAELKARRVSSRHREALVIGADQMLDCDGIWLDKPMERAVAAAQLLALAGRRHELPTSVCVVRDGNRIWHHNETPCLVMRPFDEGFIEHYLDATGEEVLGSLGAYQLEGLGVQLFARVEGDFFTILGLPLLPLLEVLRSHGVVPR